MPDSIGCPVCGDGQAVLVAGGFTRGVEVPAFYFCRDLLFWGSDVVERLGCGAQTPASDVL